MNTTDTSTIEGHDVGDAGAPSRSVLPDFYDDLGASLAHAWLLLARGAKDRRSPMHTPAVATIGLEGMPQVRTVVLRGADPAGRVVRFHSDARSPKIAALRANPAITMLAYDPGAKIQLRLSGQATVHQGDAIAQAAWDVSSNRSRTCYSQVAGPGTLLMQSAAGQEPPSMDGYRHFTVVAIKVDSLDWLYLAHAGHRRARFAWQDDRLDASWIAP